MRRLILALLVFALIVFAIAHYHHTPAPAPETQQIQAPTASEPPPTQPLNAHIYNEDTDAKKDIAGALALAQATNKNVLLDFGANWCPDCQVLDIYMHDEANSDLITRYYIPVHIDVGRMDKNLNVAYTFNVPINKGIPALAVVQPSGRVVYSQTHGEFNNMRAMQSSDLTEFLKMWRPHGPNPKK
jgi:thiol:disulfide interchange protein